VVDGVPPVWREASASPPPQQPPHRSAVVRQLLALLLSLCLGLFLADGLVSLADDSLILLFDIHLLTGLRGMVFLFAGFIGLVVYGLMGLTPLIPKRWFLPLTLFSPLGLLLCYPLVIYFHDRMQQVSWVLSLCQVLLGLGLLYGFLGGWKLRWVLVAERQLGSRTFSWWNLGAFLAVNVVVLAPAVLLYLVVCTSLAVSHFSDGFVALRPQGLTVQVRTYVRDDGKKVQLFPMSHIGDPAFYQSVARSFPADSIILMEGVTDSRNLLTNKIKYERVASSLGLVEQAEAFEPAGGEVVPADVDVEDFTPNTIAFLNLVMLVHAKGAGWKNMLELMQFVPPPGFEEELIEDLLTKRNRHLLEELTERLPETDHLIVPWGAAHMPGIARELEQAGFQLEETWVHVAIRFRFWRDTEEDAASSDDAVMPD